MGRPAGSIVTKSADRIEVTNLSISSQSSSRLIGGMYINEVSHFAYYFSMEDVLNNASVKRISAELEKRNISGAIKILSDSARSAAEAAAALGIEVGQIASSIVFKLPDGRPLLVITSGAHRVDTELVARTLGVEKLHRADANFVKSASGISIGGVSPFGWQHDGTLPNPEPVVLIDVALDAFDVVWAAAGHPHAVFPTSYAELVQATKAVPVSVEA